MWTPVEKAKPEHGKEVLLWVTGGPIHYNEDYPVVGMYNLGTNQFVHYNDGDDLVVKVSHWQYIHSPRKVQDAEKENRVKLASLPPLNPNPKEAFTTQESTVLGMDANEGRYIAITAAKLRQRSGPLSHKSSKGPKRGRS